MARHGWMRSEKRREALATGLIVVWGVFILLAFHPFRDGVPPLLASALAGTFAWANVRELAARVGAGQAVVVLWAVAVGGLGRVVLPLAAPRLGVDRVDRLALGLGLGFAAGTLLWLGLGLVGLWLPVVAWVVTGAGWWLAASGARPPVIARKFSSATGGPGGWAGIVFGVLAAVSFAIVAAGTALPETAPDPLIYHLALPEVFAAEHRIVPSTQIFHASLPMGAPMHYGWMLLLGGEPAVRAWRGWVLAAILWLVYRLAAREGRPGAGLIAAGIFATLPPTAFLGSATYVDLEACALGLLACLAIRVGGFRRTVLGGVLAGGAAAVKLTTVVLWPGLVVGAGRKIPRTLLRRDAAAGMAATVVLAPWSIRNLLLVANPVAPFGESRLRTFRAMGETNRVLLAAHTHSRLADRWRAWPALPWLSARGMNEETRLGPVILMAAPGLVLTPPVGPFAAYAWVAGLGAVGWAANTHIPRYALSVWALCAVLMAASLWSALCSRRAGPRWRAAAAAGCIALFGCETVTRSLPVAAGLLPVWLGRMAPHETLTRLSNSYAGIGSILPPGARVLLVGEMRGAHWPVAVINRSPYDRELAEEILSSAPSAAVAARRLRQLAGWIYVNDAETGRMVYTLGFPGLTLDARGERLAADVWRSWMDEAARTGPGILWRIRTRSRVHGPWPAVPLTFNAAALREAYGPFTVMSFGTPVGGTTTIRIRR